MQQVLVTGLTLLIVELLAAREIFGQYRWGLGRGREKGPKAGIGKERVVCHLVCSFRFGIIG
jgi:hypothetical protein